MGYMAFIWTTHTFAGAISSPLFYYHLYATLLYQTKYSRFRISLLFFHELRNMAGGRQAALRHGI